VDVLFRGIKAVLCGRRELGHGFKKFKNTYSQPANIHSVKAANEEWAGPPIKALCVVVWKWILNPLTCLQLIAPSKGPSNYRSDSEQRGGWGLNSQN
jgi:hypothetical protein